MKTKVHCDTCRTVGYRHTGHLCPIGWFYTEAVDDDDPSDPIVSWFCTRDCAEAQIKEGPGRLDLTCR